MADLALLALGYMVGSARRSRHHRPPSGAHHFEGTTLSGSTRALLKKVRQQAERAERKVKPSGYTGYVFVVVLNESALLEELESCNWAHRVRSGVSLHLHSQSPDRAKQYAYALSVVHSLSPLLGYTLLEEKQ